VLGEQEGANAATIWSPELAPVSLTAAEHGGARRPTVLVSYEGPNDAIEGSKDAQAHRGANGLLGGADC
jgi:hypothetical protein